MGQILNMGIAKINSNWPFLPLLKDFDFIISLQFKGLPHVGMRLVGKIEKIFYLELIRRQYVKFESLLLMNSFQLLDLSNFNFQRHVRPHLESDQSENGLVRVGVQ